MKTRYRILSAVLAVVGLVGCTPNDPNAIICIKLQTTSGQENLGVRSAYLYWDEDKKGGKVGSFSVYLKWADLSPTPARILKFDPSELKDPHWSIKTTSAAGFIMIDGVGNGTWPLRTPPEVTKWDAPTEFPGWREVRWCRDCSNVNYFPESGNADIDHIDCAPPITFPARQACQVWARVEGANMSISFPLLRLKDYRLFVSRAALLMRQFRDVGKKACR